jgi:hypothetical protein
VPHTIWRPNRFNRGGDHESLFTEPNENLGHQHEDVRVVNGVQFSDLAKFCVFEFNVHVAQVNRAALWSLAQAPGTPKNVKMNAGVLTNNSALNWNTDPSADGGYEIVWRALDVSQWTHVVPGLGMRPFNCRMIMRDWG